jgi:hypothetical protein
MTTVILRGRSTDTDGRVQACAGMTTVILRGSSTGARLRGVTTSDDDGRRVRHRTPRRT